MKEYVITEAELDEISLLNTLASVCFSLGSAAILFAVGLLSSAVIQGTLSERANGFVQMGEWVGFIIGGLAMFFGILAWVKRYSKVNLIKRLAEEVEQPSSVAQLPMSSQLTPDNGTMMLNNSAMQGKK